MDGKENTWTNAHPYQKGNTNLKPQWEYYIPTRRVKIEKPDSTKCWWRSRVTGTLIYWWL